MTNALGIGVIGLGFMGRTHVAAIAAAARAGSPCRLAGVADSDPSRLSGRAPAGGNLPAGIGQGQALFDPRQLRTCTDAHALIADPCVDAVSICTHTDTHVDLAIAALKAGKHVLVEKPVALSSADAQRLAAAARDADRLCMPAMCMRFWPGWTLLRDAIVTGVYGPVQSATFHRLGCRPDWTPFYADTARSGGALLDLHIHDTDFIRWCFGEPARVTSTGSLHHITTLYHFRQPGHVVAEGGTDHTPGFGFRMRYVVAFEHTTADFDLGRPAPLLLHRDGRSESVVLPEASAYQQQIDHFASAVIGRTSPAATIDDAVATLRLIEAEARSLHEGRTVEV